MVSICQSVTLQSKCLFSVQGMNYEKLPLKVSFFRRVKSTKILNTARRGRSQLLRRTVLCGCSSPGRALSAPLFLQHSVSCPSAFFSFMLCLSLCYALCLCSSIASLCYVATVDSTKSSWPAYR